MTNTDEDNNNKSALNNNQNKIIKINTSSIPSSIITQSNGESAELNKLKNEIINKADFFYIKLMKYINLFFTSPLILTTKDMIIKLKNKIKKQDTDIIDNKCIFAILLIYIHIIISTIMLIKK